MKKAIYSELFGLYDTLNPAPSYLGWDCILFTDLELSDYKGWIPVRIESKDPKKDSRKFKWLSHRYLKDYDLVCHIDANVVLKREPPKQPLWFKHPNRRTVKEEASRIKQLLKDNSDLVDRQIQFYGLLGFPDDKGLYQNRFFVRKHSEKQNALCEAVWGIIEQWSYRDQLALPIAIWSTGIYPDNVSNYSYSRNMYAMKPHRSMVLPSVHHITPGRSDKDLGRAINELVGKLPEEDWICLRDIDTVPPYHIPFFSTCEEIAKENQFGLIGCMTNRLGLSYQLHNGAINDDPNFENHIEIGKKRYEEFGSSVRPISSTIAGLFMLFPKSTWTKIGGFREGPIILKGVYLDYWISMQAIKKGIPIGIAEGIYLWHTYRLGMGNPKGNTKHLF